MSSRSIGILALVGVGVLGSTACGLALGIKDITVDQGAGGGGSTGTSSSNTSTASAGGSTTSTTTSSATSSGTTVGTGGSGGCMANITNDTHNCGACGHDCQGTMCTASICDTITLAQGQDLPGPIAVDGTAVYWMNVETPAVEVVVKTGGGMPTQIAKSGSAGYVAVDDTNVYWTDPQPGLVMTVPKIGIGKGQNAVIAMGELDPYVITFDAGSVYFTTDHAIIVLEKGPYKRSALVSNVGAPTGLFADSTAVYWTDALTDDVHLYIHGGSDAVIAKNQGSPTFVTSDDQFAYWTNSLGGTVNKVDISGGSAMQIATGAQTPQSLVMDATTLYWVDFGAGKIMKMPKAGGTPVALTASISPQFVVVDDLFAYFTAKDGTVRRVAK